MYDTILALLVSAVGAIQGTLIYDTLVVIATCACVFVVVIPFIVVYKGICLIFDLMRR